MLRKARKSERAASGSTNCHHAHMNELENGAISPSDYDYAVESSLGSTEQKSNDAGSGGTSGGRSGSATP